jgi:hypothetical protein
VGDEAVELLLKYTEDRVKELVYPEAELETAEELPIVLLRTVEDDK